MKNIKIKLVLLSVLFMGLCQSAMSITITKTPSKSVVRVGETFEYVVTISNISNLNELGSIQDILDPNLVYLGTDFNTTSNVYGFYAMMCPAYLSEFSIPPANSTGTLTFQFPTNANCNASGFGTLSFTIQVAVTASACPPNINILNTIKLLDRTGVQATSGSCTVNLDHTNPWTITKTFREYNNGFLVYDIRLNSSVGNYNLNVFQNAQFQDIFTMDPCLIVDVSQSQIVYIPNEAQLNNFIVQTGVFSSNSTQVEFQWVLPNLSGTAPTLSGYLFQARIKTTCNSGCPPFTLHNQVEFLGTDLCGNQVNLPPALSNIPGVSCLNGTCGVPETAKLCVKKEVHLNGNNMNLTMNECFGNYVIKIENCTNGFTYTNINLTDIFPSQLIVVPADITINPAFAPFLQTTSNGINFNTSSDPLFILAPGGTITIIIPFQVNTSIPNEFIQNCADISVTLNDGINPAEIITKTFCDAGIKTVPNYVEIVRSKTICNPPSNNCQLFNISNNHNLPGDHVNYALHFYNYGTTKGQNVIIEDNLPSYFSVLNPATDIKIYKRSDYGNVVPDVCNLIGFTDITSDVTVTVTGGLIKIVFPANHVLNGFTCDGITHYIVKINTAIATNVPDGSYTNSYSIKYLDLSDNTSHTVFANPVTSIVSHDGLVFTQKTVTKTHNCNTKKVVLEYKIRLLNLGLQNIYANLTDNITVPFPLSVSTGLYNLEYTTCNSAVSCSGPETWTPLVTGGGVTVITTATHLTINGLLIPSCSMLKIRYRIELNTNNVNDDQIRQVCNNLKVEVGYNSFTGIQGIKDKSPIMLVSNPYLINQYFNSASELEKYRIVKQMKAEKKPMRAYLQKLPTSGENFVAVDTIQLPPVCIGISDCLDGDTSICFSNPPANATFKITDIDANGVAHTQLNIPGSQAVTKIEYILSDIRMLGPCGPPGSIFCCSKTTIGVFHLAAVSDFSSVGSPPLLNYVSSWIPGPGLFKEINRVEFSGLTTTIVSPVNKNFKLPFNTTNCNGNLEVVITAIIYYANCSVCYISDSKDRHCNYNWNIPNPH